MSICLWCGNEYQEGMDGCCRSCGDGEMNCLCEHVYYDGAGHYCKLINMEKYEDYPHKHFRVMCFGKQGGYFSCVKCEGFMRVLKNNFKGIKIQAEG